MSAPAADVVCASSHGRHPSFPTNGLYKPGLHGEHPPPAIPCVPGWQPQVPSSRGDWSSNGQPAITMTARASGLPSSAIRAVYSPSRVGVSVTL